MKKALHGRNEVFVIEQQGNVVVWDFFAEEIVEAANRALEKQGTGWLATESRSSEFTPMDDALSQRGCDR